MRRALGWSVAAGFMALAAVALSREPERPLQRPYSLIDSVSATRIEADVRRLSTYPGGEPRSRFTLRPELETEAVAFVDSVLRRSLPAGDTVFVQRWRWKVGADTLELPNVVAIHRGTHPGTGAYLVCAHLDAIGSRSPGWSWATSPSPGADDNGSGTAAVLEAARALGRERFDFDIFFLLFSGEEQGLLGSKAFAESLFVSRAPVYGVFNLDMIAYREAGGPSSIEGMPNRLSKWMSDLLARRASEIGEATLGVRYIPTPAASINNSDQASFWPWGYDGILLIESVQAGETNPHYHTVDDLSDSYSPDGLRYGQAAGTVRLVVAALDGFRFAPANVADLVVEPDQITFSVAGIRRYPAVVDPGETVVIAGAALSQGGSIEGASTLFQYRDETGVLPDGEHVRFGWRPAGAVVRDSLTWMPLPSDAGVHIVEIRVGDPTLPENDGNDNVAMDTVLVRGSGMRVLDHFVYPNPVRLSAGASLSNARLRFATGRQGSASVEIFDLSGRRVGRTHEDLVSTGAYTEVPLSAILDGRSLASGVYFYKVRVRGAGGEATATGRFALLR